ncbi:MAG: peptidoglycan-binding domain-containing protein [candidate division WOR-3 bacterium]
MPELNGVRPRDLPERPVVWSPWPIEDRIAAAQRLSGFTPRELQVAVAITLNEQPRRIPCNNCCGFMCWGATRPWGWKPDVWEDRPPNGYALAPEGQAGKTGVFLAFRNVTDSLFFLAQKVRSRRITSAEAYADRWVADPVQRAGAIAGFNYAFGRVDRAWPGNQPGPTLKYGDAGPEVSRLQRLLNDCGFPVPVTGRFLDKTRAAVIGFQQSNRDAGGNPLDPDGKVGRKTWWSLIHHER